MAYTFYLIADLILQALNFQIKKHILKITAAACGLFGLLTLVVGSSVIFDWFGIRQLEGNYVLFIVYANVACAFLYLAAVYGLLKRKNWTVICLAIALLILITAFAKLMVHIQSGGIYETKTVKAMLFRIGVTAAFTAIAWFRINKNGSGIDE